MNVHLKQVAIGGFIIVDDYGIESCSRAVDTFREFHAISVPDLKSRAFCVGNLHSDVNVNCSLSVVIES
jgi:hypothetical protein